MKQAHADLVEDADGGQVAFHDQIQLEPLVLAAEERFLVVVLLRDDEDRLPGEGGEGDPLVVQRAADYGSRGSMRPRCNPLVRVKVKFTVKNVICEESSVTAYF